MKKILTKKTLLALSSLALINGAFAQETEPLKDLYPLGDKAPVTNEISDAVEDSVSNMLDGLELTDEEKALLNSPDLEDDQGHPLNEKLPEHASQTEEKTPKEASEKPFEEEADNFKEKPEETSTEEKPTETAAEQKDETAEESETTSEDKSDEITDEFEDVDSEESDEGESEEEKKAPSLAGVSEVPAKKRPKPIDEEKAKAAEEKDENPEVPEKNRNKIKFGTPSEISGLIDELTANDDPRFTEELYDLFQVTQNVQIQQKVLEYFTKLEDPCLEDFAVTVLNDPYDTKTDVVKACFEYIEKLKTKEAEPAVFTILESENETYFNDTLATIGEIGGADAAVSLAEYLDREDLSDAQRQTLMRTLGKLHAVETFDKIVDILENEDENSFVRMFAAEALGLMEKKEAVPHLINAFKDANPNLRQYAIKGLAYFPKDDDAKAAIIQGVRDEHWKVRQEAINACKQMELKEAIEYLEYRAENDTERVIKEAAITTLAKFDDKDATDFLIALLDKKISDPIKLKVVHVLLEAEKGYPEIIALTEKSLAEVRYKNLTKGLGKELTKFSKPEFADVCLKYLDNTDTDIINLGLDIFKNGRTDKVEAKVRLMCDDKKYNTTIRKRCKKLLGIEEETDKDQKEKKE